MMVTDSQFSLFLFDADDTLYDFSTTEKEAFSKTWRHLDSEFRLDEIFMYYKTVSRELWDQLERGVVTKDFLKVERFRRTFDKFGISECPIETSETYLNRLSQESHLMEGALELCKHLSQLATIGIITNGIATVQRSRIANSEIAPYISFIAVSEDCGFTKPDPRIFDYALSLTAAVDRGNILMIGDKYEADILGAHHAQIASCYFNPKSTPLPVSSPKPTFEVSRLSQIRQLI